MYEEYIGKRYGRLIVIGVYLKKMKSGKRAARAICKCDCGTTKEIQLFHLKGGETTSCGCYQRELAKSTAIDRTGQIFGEWSVLRRDETKSRRYWICRCSCGTERSVQINNLISGHSTSCGCVQKQTASKRYVKDETGKRFGRLIVLNLVRKLKGNKICIYFRCKCDCGNETEVWGPHLRSGRTISCGCYQKDRAIETHTTHGLTYTKEYMRWQTRKRKEMEKQLDSEWSMEMELFLRNLFQQCVLCGITNTEHIEKYGHPLHVDHVEPLYEGNGLKPGNATILCASCNSSKGAKSLSDLSDFERNRLTLTAELFDILWSNNYGTVGGALHESGI